MDRLLPGIAVALSLAACPSTDEPAKSPAEDRPHPATPEASAEPANAEPSLPAIDPDAIRVTPTSVGVLTTDADTPEELAALFPDYRLDEAEFAAEGEVYAVYRLYAGDVLMLEVEPFEGAVSTAIIHDPAVVGPDGVHAGTSLDALGLTAKVQCFVEEEGVDRILCPYEGVEHVQVVFSTEGLGTLEPGADVSLDVLADRTILGLRWLPGH